MSKYDEYEIASMFLIWPIAAETTLRSACGSSFQFPFTISDPRGPALPRVHVSIVRLARSAAPTRSRLARKPQGSACFFSSSRLFLRSSDTPSTHPRRLPSHRPLRNRDGGALSNTFPMRCILEDEGSILNEERPLHFAGVPHGLFPIGMLALALCNCLLPFRWTRGAAASRPRLPIWRQVLAWNGGIDVSRNAIINALKQGDNVAVMSDGGAGMFAADLGMRKGKEVMLLKKRRGLVRIALETGSPLVPFVCFGNTRARLPATDCVRRHGVALSVIGRQSHLAARVDGACRCRSASR